jgi:hypothetical protein
MQTKLDRLLEFISPEKTIVETFNRANEALNTFRVHTARIEEWDQFQYFMAEFLRHLESCILRLRTPINGHFEYNLGQCNQLLRKIYGSSGEKAAFEMARTGNESGLYGVLKAVAMHIAEDYSKREISAKVASYWDSLSADEQCDVCSEYISKYGHLIPSEITEGSAARIKANFWKVLEEHPRMLLRLQNVGR